MVIETRSSPRERAPSGAGGNREAGPPGESAPVERPRPPGGLVTERAKPLFGIEGIPKDDLRAIGVQLTEHLKHEDVFAVAQQLAHLRRAGVGVGEAKREAVFTKLRVGLDAVRAEGDAVRLGQYLKYLKYVRAIGKLDESDARHLNEGIVTLAQQGEYRSLSQLCLDAKYLGARDDFSGEVLRVLEEGLRREYEQPANAERVALELARRKYLGIGFSDYPLAGETAGDTVSRTLKQRGVHQRVEEVREGRQWDTYTRLRNWVDYLTGGSRPPVPPAAQEGIISELRRVAVRARFQGDWRGYVRFAGDVAALSQPVDESLVAATEPVAVAPTVDVTRPAAVEATAPPTAAPTMVGDQEAVPRRPHRRRGSPRQGRKRPDGLGRSLRQVAEEITSVRQVPPPVVRRWTKEHVAQEKRLAQRARGAKKARGVKGPLKPLRRGRGVPPLAGVGA